VRDLEEFKIIFLLSSCLHGWIHRKIKLRGFRVPKTKRLHSPDLSFNESLRIEEAAKGGLLLHISISAQLAGAAGANATYAIDVMYISVFLNFGRRT
jgi:hypothetical protein